MWRLPSFCQLILEASWLSWDLDKDLPGLSPTLDFPSSVQKFPLHTTCALEGEASLLLLVLVLVLVLLVPRVLGMWPLVTLHLTFIFRLLHETRTLAHRISSCEGQFRGHAAPFTQAGMSVGWFGACVRGWLPGPSLACPTFVSFARRRLPGPDFA